MHVCGKGRPTACTHYCYVCVCVREEIKGLQQSLLGVCVREAVTEFSLMLRVCVGRGDRMLALINIMYVCGKGRYIACTN